MSYKGFEITSVPSVDELEQRNRELATMVAMMRDIPRTLDLTEVLKRVTELAARVCGAHRCTIVLRKENGEEAWDPVMSMFGDGREDPDMWRRFKDRGYPLQLSQVSEAEKVIRDRSPLFIPDALNSSLPDHLIEPFGIRSALLVPLIGREEVIGLMVLDQVEEGGVFTERQVGLATSLAAQAALAIEDARLCEEAQRRADELSSLEAIARELSSTLDSERIVEQVLEKAMEATRAKAGGIGIVAPDRERILLVSARGYSSQLIEQHIKTDWSLERGIVGRVARTGEAALVRDVTGDTDYVSLTEEPMGCELAVPIRVDEDMAGVLCLESAEVEGFDQRDLRFVEHLGEYAGIAVRNARLYERERRQVRQASLLNVVARQANTILTPERLLPAVARVIQVHSDYDSAIFMLIDPENDDLTIAGKSGVGADTIPKDFRQSLSEGIIGWVARHGEPLLVNDVSEDERYYAPFPDRFQAGSELAVPLKIEGETVGVLDLQRREMAGFDDLSIATAQTLAEQIAIALQNARLYDEAQRRVEELTALRNIDVALTSTLSLDEVLERIHGQISRVIPTVTFYVGIYDEKRQELHIPVVVDQGRRLDPFTLKIDEGRGFGGWAVRHGKPLWIDDWEEERDTLPVEGIPRGTPTRSLMVLPLVSRGKSVGVISAQSYEPHAFDEHHRRLFSAAANQVAIAVENAKLFEQTKRRLTETRLLQQIMQAAASHLNFDKVLERTIKALHRMLGVEHLSFAIPDEDETVLHIHPSQIGYSPSVTNVTVPLDGSVSGRAYQTGEPQIVPDVEETPYYFEGSQGMRSEISVPVKVGGRVIAVLNAESPEVNAFDTVDLRLFQAVAAQLGVVLENTRLYQKLQEQKNELSEAFEKLSEVDRLRTELVQNVSHELRTPFSLVQGYIDLMLEGDLGPILEEQREALEIIRSRIGTLKTLFRDLAMLDEVSRRDTSSTPTSMVDAACSALHDFRALAQRAGIRLREELTEKLPLVQADKEQLIQVFAHLLDNAIKFSPGGGTVTIRGWEEEREGIGQSCVSVVDEGIGIEPEHLDHIFERFYQADGGAGRRFGGMGVGLALVREIVETHDGRVDVESTPGEGSTFTVRLPQTRRHVRPGGNGHEGGATSERGYR
jgi:GAF domain-containing protein